jgi:hypothetical protein
MPQPTREQFDAAAKKVVATAPSGLTRDEFFTLVDSELKKSTLGEPDMTIPNPQTFEKPPSRFEDLGLRLADTVNDSRFGKDQFGEPYKASAAVRGAMNRPLVHPTGVDAIDGLTSPSSLVLGLASMAKPAARGAAAVLEKPNLRTFAADKLRQFGESTGNKGPTMGELTRQPPQVNEPWMPETADPEGWRRSSQAPPELFEHPSGWEPEAADLEGWRKTPRDPHDPLTVQPTNQTDKVRASNLDDEIGRLMGGGTPGHGTSAPVMEHLPEGESSGWPPSGGQGDWHSGAEPGSPEAAQASTLHSETRALDNASAMNPNDRDALMELLTKMFPPQRP